MQHCFLRGHIPLRTIHSSNSVLEAVRMCACDFPRCRNIADSLEAFLWNFSLHKNIWSSLLSVLPSAHRFNLQSVYKGPSVSSEELKENRDTAAEFKWKKYVKVPLCVCVCWRACMSVFPHRKWILMFSHYRLTLGTLLAWSDGPWRQDSIFFFLISFFPERNLTALPDILWPYCDTTPFTFQSLPISITQHNELFNSTPTFKENAFTIRSSYYNTAYL